MKNLMLNVLNMPKTNNRTRFDDLKNLMINKNISLFIGAGMTAEMHGTWKAFIEEIAQKTRFVSDQESKFNAMVKKGNLIDAATYLTEIMGEDTFKNYVKEKFSKKNISEKKIKSLALCQFSEIYDGPIYTTNYDTIIETIFPKYKVFSNIIIGDRISEQLSECTAKNGKKYLVKFHGTIDEINSCVVNKSDYDKIYSANSSYRYFIENIFNNNCFLFLGASLEDDILCDVLKDNNQFTNRHYAILEMPEGDKYQEKEKKLGEMGVLPIWYPHGEHKYVKLIIKELVKKPSEKNKKSNLNKKQNKNEVRRVSLKDIETFNNDSLIELENRIADTMSEEITNDEISPKYLVPPKLHNNMYEETNGQTIDNVIKTMLKNKEHIYLIAGKAGYGKSITIGQIKRKLEKENNVNSLLITENKFKYLCNRKIKMDESAKLVLNSVYEKKGVYNNKRKKKTVILIDSMEEVVYKNKNYTKVINKFKRNGYILVIGIRNSNIEEFKKVQVNFKVDNLFLTEWKNKEIESFIKKRLKDEGLRCKFYEFLKDNKTVKDLMKTPFYAFLTIFIFITRRSANNLSLKNIYSLYELFYEKWVRRELLKYSTNDLDKYKIFQIHYYLAHLIYTDNKKITLEQLLKKMKFNNTRENREIIGSILKIDPTNNEIINFFHDTFVEFFIVKKVIDTIISGQDKILEIFPIQFKHFNVEFYEYGIQNLSQVQENLYRDNLEILYYSLLDRETQLKFQNLKYDQSLNIKSNIIGDGRDKDRIRNSIIYAYGKIRGTCLRNNPDFLIKVYDYDPNIRVKCCAANAGIKHEIFLKNKYDHGKLYEDDFIDKIISDSSWSRALRSISLVFWKDETKQDILDYTDDGKNWNKVRERCIKRLNANDQKCIRTRMLDLSILLIFYRSRQWNDLTQDDYKKISDCDIYSYMRLISKLYNNNNRIVEYKKTKFNSLLDEIKNNLESLK